MKHLASKVFIKPIEKFLKTESAAGFILAACAVLAMTIANSSLSTKYFQLLHFSIFGLSVQHWINDGLMAIFFFVIGMEIKKEIIIGELSTLKKAALPIAAAIGGMIFPAFIYFYFNPENPDLRGWGIPMATDIAFALGVLVLFGKRVPLSLKIFLLALAIVDDLGAILVIAFFYTKEIRIQGLGLAGLGLGLMLFIRNFGIRSYSVYLILGVATWLGVLFSGVHATVAGVIIGILTPLSFPRAKGSPAEYSPLDELVHRLHPWVSFAIMPIFALANAGLSIRELDLSQIIYSPIFQGVTLGLIIGKPMGIVLFSAVAVLLGLAELPSGLRWKHIVGVSFLGGIGFTMALFISNLALMPEQEVYSKVGILGGSLIAAVFGGILLLIAFKDSNYA